MTEAHQPVDFDTRPPMPVNEYEQTARRVNAGYDLLFTLTASFLRGLHQPALSLLVVGAGGGMEIEAFMPQNPGWHLTGVDPSQDMLALAQQRAERLGVADRVTLIRGRVGDVPSSDRFDAATCLAVLHFLPDDEKLALLQGIFSHLPANGSLLVASPTEFSDHGLHDDFLAAWQAYGEAMGMPAEQMAATIARLTSMPATSEEDYLRLLREAGFRRAACFFSALGAVKAWIARRDS